VLEGGRGGRGRRPDKNRGVPSMEVGPKVNLREDRNSGKRH